MIELMNCQMCGAQPHFRDFDAYEERHAFTHNHHEVVRCSCGMSAQHSHWAKFKGQMTASAQRIYLKGCSSWDVFIYWKTHGELFDKHLSEQVPKCQEDAAIKWNTLQKLIARGKLLDEPAKAPRKAKRV